MKRFLLILGITSAVVCLCMGFAFLYVEKRVTKFELPEGKLKWSKTRPQNAKMCLPAAFTDVNGGITGAYRINGKSYNDNNQRKVSLVDNSFIISPKWRSGNGFQQLTLVYNSKPMTFKDSRKYIRRALCKTKKEAFVLESNYPMTMSAFANYCSKYCTDAAYLDMGEYGYGYIKYGCFVRPLYVWGYFSREKQTNWLYVE